MVKVGHIGYARKSKSGKALKLDISMDAFLTAERYKTKENKEYVGLLVNMNKLMDILEGKREVTSVNQVENSKEPVATEA